MSDYASFISKKIVFAATVHGSKPLLKRSDAISIMDGCKSVKSNTAKKQVNIVSVAAGRGKKSSAF